MVYCSTGKIETIMCHPMNNLNEVHYVDMIMSPDDPTFIVTCCCDDDWCYEFWYDVSTYERVKYNIMEAIFQCSTMDELMKTLSEVFEDGFADALVCECEFGECDGDCAYCDCN